MPRTWSWDIPRCRKEDLKKLPGRPPIGGPGSMREQGVSDRPSQYEANLHHPYPHNSGEGNIRCPSILIRKERSHRFAPVNNRPSPKTVRRLVCAPAQAPMSSIPISSTNATSSWMPLQIEDHQKSGVNCTNPQSFFWGEDSVSSHRFQQNLFARI